MGKKTKTGKNKPISQAAKAVTDPQTQELESMYTLSEHWRSDLDFFRDERNFLRKLVDRYILWLTDDNNIADARGVFSRLVQLEARRLSIEKQVAAHLSRLTDLLQNPFAHDHQESRDDHRKIEDAIAEFTNLFRDLKKDVFVLTEKVIDSGDADNAQHQIRPNI